MAARTSGHIPLVIEGVDQATSKWANTASSAGSANIPLGIKFRNLTMSKLNASIIGVRGANTINQYVICEDVLFEQGSGGTAYEGWFHQCGRMYFINCGGADMRQGWVLSSNLSATVLCLGCTFQPNQAYNVLCCRGAQLGPPATQLGNSQGPFFAWNLESRNVTSGRLIDLGGIDYGPRGFAVVGNVFECYHPSGSPNIAVLSADGHELVANVNMNVYGNSGFGERVNVAYNSSGTALVTHQMLFLDNVVTKLNIKGDMFTTANANRTGNWDVRYRVGMPRNTIDQGSSNGDVTVGPSSWLGDYVHAGENVNAPVVVVNNKSSPIFGGAGGGGGDYTPVSGIGQIPAGQTFFAVDLFGRDIPTDGTAYQGAVQVAA
jgi:hypothetical protein